MADLLFTLRVRLSGGTAVIKAYDAGFRPPNHTRLDCELRWNGKIVFPVGATYCGIPGQYSIDGINAKECVMDLFCLKPGDTDSEYFESYTPEQLAWVEEHGEELSCERQARYCDENGNVRRSR